MTHFIALFLYIGALVLWLRTLASGERGAPAVLASLVASAGVLAHLIALAAYQSQYGELPLIGLAPSLSTLSLITGLGLLATLGLGEAGSLGILLVPLMIVLEGSALLIGIEPAPGSLDFQGAWFTFHVVLAFAAIGGMALSSAAGALYLAQHRELKHKRMGRMFRFLPPLATLSRISRTAAALSLVLLTLGVALGWAWTVSFRNSLEGGDPKTIWAVFIWALILTTVLVWRGGAGTERRGALASVLAFVMIAISYLLLLGVAGEGGLFL